MPPIAFAPRTPIPNVEKGTAVAPRFGAEGHISVYGRAPNATAL